MSAADRARLTYDGQPLDRFMSLGAFCEHVVVPASMAIPIDEVMPPVHACLIGCAVMTGFGAIECVGQPQTIRQAFQTLRPGGRAVVVGLPEHSAQIELPAILLLQERSLVGSMYGSANPPLDFPTIASLYEQERLDLASLVGEVLPFEDIQKGIELTRSGSVARMVIGF